MTSSRGRIITFLLIALLSVAFAPGSSRAQGQEARHANINKDGVILNGYDVVTYFLGTPEKGKPEFAVNHEGVNYWFAKAENREIFLKNAEKFVPAYGGWCAYAMGESGEKVKIDPQTFKIIEGRLYLFYNFFFNNTLITWNEDESNLRQKADLHWQRIIKP